MSKMPDHRVKTVAEQAVHHFPKPEDAAAFYLKRALDLPGDLDGWKVVR
jgi:hypothetical protein